MTVFAKYMVPLIVWALFGPSASLAAENNIKTETEIPLSDIFEAQPGTAKRLNPQQVQLDYMYTAPNTCWLPGTAQVAAVQDGVMVVLLTPEITDRICATRLTPLNYAPIFEAPQTVQTIFVQVMHPMGGHIETSEILIAQPHLPLSRKAEPLITRANAGFYSNQHICFPKFMRR